MRNSNFLRTKCKCDKCFFNGYSCTESPCLTCSFTGAGEHVIGTKFVIHTDSVTEEINLLKQRIEQLEYERLVGCLCRNTTIDAKIDKNHIPKRKHYVTNRKISNTHVDKP